VRTSEAVADQVGGEGVAEAVERDALLVQAA